MRVGRISLFALGVACAPAATPAPAPAPSAAPAPLSAPAAPGGPRRVAVTFDDLPAHGPTKSGETRLDVHRRIVETLAKHGVPGVYGFVNGAKAAEHADGRTVLEMWRDAGHPLGNHTFSHIDIGKVGAAAFIEEIDKNDAFLAELVGDDPAARRARRRFRYPYLRQGPDRETLDTVRAHLAKSGYQLAEVTIDFGDWAYNPPYVRCSAQAAAPAIEALRWDFVHRGVQALEWSEAAARSIYGEPVPHVLLLHSGSFDAEVLDELLTAYETAGATWITLDEALAHPAYVEDVRVPAKYGGTLLEQKIERDKPPHPPFALQPVGLLEQICRTREKN